MPKNNDEVNKIIDGLSDDEIDALYASIEVRDIYEKGRTKWKSVPIESVEYVDGIPRRVVNYKPVSYKDIKNYPDLISNPTKGVSYSEYLESLPYYDEIKDQIFDKKGNRKGLYTDKNIAIVPGVRRDVNFYSLRDAKEVDIIRHYRVKNSILKQYCTWVDAKVFYEDLYSVPSNFNSNDIGTIVYCKKDADRRYKIFDDYNVGVITNDSNLLCYPFSIYVPTSGWLSTKEKMIKNIFALVVDIDSVYAGQLYNFFQYDWGYFKAASYTVTPYLKPTYIVNSGSGLHLYYVFKTPVPYFKGNYPNADIINKLVEKIQSKYNVCYDSGDWALEPEGLCGWPQKVYKITQAFRMAGSATKNNKRATVYKYGDKYDISEIMSWLGVNSPYKIAFRHSDRNDNYKKDKEKEIKDKNRIKRLDILKNEIPINSKDIMSDMLIYTKNCASAGVGFEKVIEDLRYILEVYKGLTDDNIDINIEDGVNLDIIHDAYNSIDGRTYIDDKEFSFKIKKTSEKKKFKKGYYIGKRNQVMNNIVVSYRYTSIFYLGIIAWGCGVPKDEYIKDMNIVYDIIKDHVIRLGQEEFTDKDFEDAIGGWDYARKNYKYISPKRIEDTFSFIKNKDKKQYEKKKVPDMVYISWLYHRIDSYVLRDIHVKFKNSENIPNDIEVYIPDVDDLIRYIKEKDAEFSDDNLRGLNAEAIRKVNEKINKTVRYKTDSGDEKEAIIPVSKYLFKKYYSAAIRFFKAMVKKGSGSYNKMMVHTLDDDDNDINVEVTLNYVKTLDNRKKVQEAMNKGLSSIQSIMNYTQLSKCSVIKYRKEILGCD